MLHNPIIQLKSAGGVTEPGPMLPFPLCVALSVRFSPRERNCQHETCIGSLIGVTGTIRSIFCQARTPTFFASVIILGLAKYENMKVK